MELTSQQQAILLHKSQTQTRGNQKRYLEDLGGDGNARELDEALARARSNEAAVREAEPRIFLNFGRSLSARPPSTALAIMATGCCE